MTRILVADDHAIVRKGLVQILSASPGPITVDEAESGEEALSKAWNKDYDLILLDISMPGRGGLEALRELKRHRPNLPVLVLSMQPEEQYAVRVLRAGAAGYLAKASAPDELVGAINKVLAGGKYISNSLAEQIAFGLLDDGEKAPHESLSNREYQILILIASGKPASVIAGELALSVKTISTYRARILKKMKMKNNAELTHYGVTYKLVD